MSWLGSVGRSGTIYPFVGSAGSTGFSGWSFPSFGVIPGSYVRIGLSPGFVGSFGLFGYLIGVGVLPGIFGIHDPSGLYVTTSVISFESPVTFTTGTLALSAKNPLTTGDLTSAKSCAGVQSPYVTSPVTKLTLASRVNLASCVTVLGVPSSFNTGVPSSYT